MEDAKKQFIEAVKQATNILVTVRKNPDLDELSACIALTLMLNELGKHATAVFSGETPSVLEFLEPEKTLQKNTDSLQDFIISLDKSKADKLRYKVEDTVVKIFITPYRTSISEKDLEYGQGDFNVDVVVALGVHAQADLDEAITAHGRILHDATVISINTKPGVSDDLGSVNWVDEQVSSLSELLAAGVDDLIGDKKEVLDNQVATALLTGIVAETERFGNHKTTPETLQVSARLLSAGANQELVATRLAAPRELEPVEEIKEAVTEAPAEEQHEEAESPAEPVAEQAADDSTGNGSIAIEHEQPEEPEVSETPAELVEPIEPEAEPAAETEPSADDGSPQPAEPQAEAVDEHVDETAASDAEVKEVHQTFTPENDPLAPAGLAGSALQAVAAIEKPQVYDLNQITVPASIPVTPSEQSALTEAAPEAPETPVEAPAEASDEQGDLDYLEQNKAVNTERTVIQPLRDQNGFLGQPPLHDRKLGPLKPADGKSVDETLDATKFAITPPTLGGRLTALHDQSDTEPSTDPLSASLVKSRPILTHGVTTTSTPEPGSPSPAMALDTEEPAAADATDITASLIASTAVTEEAPEPAEEAKTPDAEKPAAPAGATLAELEQQVHSPHVQKSEDSQTEAQPEPAGAAHAEGEHKLEAAIAPAEVQKPAASAKTADEPHPASDADGTPRQLEAAIVPATDTPSAKESETAKVAEPEPEQSGPSKPMEAALAPAAPAADEGKSKKSEQEPAEVKQEGPRKDLEAALAPADKAPAKAAPEETPPEAMDMPLPSAPAPKLEAFTIDHSDEQQPAHETAPPPPAPPPLSPLSGAAR